MTGSVWAGYDWVRKHFHWHRKQFSPRVCGYVRMVFIVETLAANWLGRTSILTIIFGLEAMPGIQ